jgi:GxxExxY protein
MQDAALTETIIGCAMKVHHALGPGFLESVYEKALAHELSKAGLQVECQQAVKVTYDGVVVGDFVADMLIAGVVLVENKAVQTLVQAHEVQLVNYLTATGIEIGLLLNFGASSLQVKRKHRTFRPKGKTTQESKTFSQS